MNKRTLDIIRQDLKEALKAIESKHKIAVTIGTMRHNDTSFVVKLDASLLDSEGNDSRKAADWKIAVATGLVEAAWLGADYDHGKFSIVGVDLKRRSNCIRIERKSDKRMFITKPEAIRRSLANA